ncbi:MAG: PspA/IM30 family protein [Candidatus Magnetoovum sp. WYHC-5]|nr:PspA/IM30 family protein [Candidatus Magnetoovum sp. WYHC-5]
MKENISKRVGRIISAGINSVIDSFENLSPETIMDEAIREVDSAIDDVREELGRELSARHMALKRFEENKKNIAKLSEQINTAIKEGRDDLAEAAIDKQMDIEAQLPVLENVIAEQQRKVKELEDYIRALQAKRRELEQELLNYKKAKATKSTQQTSGESVDVSVYDKASRTVSNAQSAFNRVMERDLGFAMNKGADLQRDAKLAELETIARQNRVKERLEVLKTQVKDG